MLVELLAAGDPAGSASSSSGLINAVRIGAAVPESSSSPSTPSSSGAGASSSSTPLASAGTKRKLLMHNDLRAVLAVDDYHALDAALYDHHALVTIFYFASWTPWRATRASARSAITRLPCSPLSLADTISADPLLSARRAPAPAAACATRYLALTRAAGAFVGLRRALVP